MRSLATILLLFLSVGGVCNAVTQQDQHAARVEALVGNMTLDEKISMLQGNTDLHGYVGRTVGVPRLGIPDLRMNDGPEGFRNADRKYAGTTTQWPSGLTAAHSFNRSLMHTYGIAIGEEFYGKGANVYFGPGLNVQRISNGGRSFEYLSGEDPFLGYELVQPIITGVQSQKVIANAKHFIDNSQEGSIPENSTEKFGRGDRHSTSASIDKTTQMEMYFPPFEGAVRAGVASFMCSNNLINGEYSCQHNATQNQLLKERYGFRGFICSDYDGTRSTIDAALGGLDIAMPGPPVRPDYFGGMLKKEVGRNVPESVVDDKVRRILWAMSSTGVLDDTNPNTPDKDVTSPEHVALARELAAASCILIKNEDSTLPLVKKSKIAVVGLAADGKGAIYGGSGSGKVTPKQPVSILDALRAEEKGDIPYTNGTNLSAISETVKGCDVVIIVLAQISTEGRDRATIGLPQSELVRAVYATTPARIIVVTISPGPFLTDFAPYAHAIVDMGFPGEQEGLGLVDVLMGRYNPSGKLPHTLPHRLNDVEMTSSQYPGIPPTNRTKNGSAPLRTCGFVPPMNPPDSKWVPCSPTTAEYTEKLLVGYRWYEHHKVKPAYAFGHGLSYTSFSYENLLVKATGGGGDVIASVSITVGNTGKCFGREVVQLYLKYPDSTYKQLRGFEVAALEQGESASFEFALTRRWLSAWNGKKDGFELVHGKFDVYIGSSSSDIREVGILYI